MESLSVRALQGHRFAWLLRLAFVTRRSAIYQPVSQMAMKTHDTDLSFYWLYLGGLPMDTQSTGSRAGIPWASRGRSSPVSTYSP